MKKLFTRPSTPEAWRKVILVAVAVLFLVGTLVGRWVKSRGSAAGPAAGAAQAAGRRAAPGAPPGGAGRPAARAAAGPAAAGPRTAGPPAAESDVEYPTLPAAAFARDLPYLLREQTAAEIMRTLQAAHGDYQLLRKNVEDLYLERFVPHPGWAGEVSSLPQCVEGRWQIQLAEAEGGPRILVHDVDQDLSNCRAGDVARVAGKIIGVEIDEVELTEPVLVIPCADLGRQGPPSPCGDGPAQAREAPREEARETPDGP